VRYNLKKAEIVRGSNLLNSIFKKGERYRGKFLNCYVLKNPADSQDRVSSVQAAFVVPKRVKLAVDRNRLKRYMRESYRGNKAFLIECSGKYSLSIKVVFLFSSQPRSSERIPEFSGIDKDMKNLLVTITGTIGICPA